MYRELTTKIINDIRHEVTSLDFLIANSLNRDDVLDMLSSKAFQQNIFDAVKNDDYSCQTVFKAFSIIASKVFPEPNQNFLEGVYSYVLAKSFPDTAVSPIESRRPDYEFYLELLKVFNDYQRHSADRTFMSVYPFELLSEAEILDLEDSSEYVQFLDAFKEQRIYEMMKLNYEVSGHSTIEHILGVHFLAMKIARQLKDKGLQIDLGRVSGAAAGHDIGKFGCLPEEKHKIAYYHYYYTDKWFEALDIHYIRNVAVYHSTWDLELESLSIESLVLIYADFCVKRAKEKDGLFKMKFLTVDESFEVILNKLDNVDDQKKRRYEKVYKKLKNFHDYMTYMGVDCYVENFTGLPLLDHHVSPGQEYSTLDQGLRVVDHLKIMAIERSIELMYRLRHIDSLNEIIQEAISEKDIQMFRRYLFIFEEYSTYLTPEQKMITINFLKPYMIHAEEDIRNEASQLIGRLLADYDENYTKELPERADVTYTVETKFNVIHDMLNQFIFLDVRLAPIKRRRQVTSYYQLLKSLYASVDEDFSNLLTDLLVTYYSHKLDEHGVIFMLEIIDIIPKGHLTQHIDLLLEFVMTHLKATDDVQMMAFTRLNMLLEGSLKLDIMKMIKTEYDISHFMTGELNIIQIYLMKPIFDAKDHDMDIDVEHLKSEMYLSNLKSATPKTVKIAQIQMLYDYAMVQGREEKFYTAMHFCNILKVSEYDLVRNKAGDHLMLLFERLTSEQKNDIVIELIRALEIEGYGFTRYIPKYLGQLIPTLDAKEYKEILADIRYKISNASGNIRILLLNLLGSMINKWLGMKRFDVLEELLGCVFNGFYSGSKLTTQIAFNVISKDVIGNESLTLTERFEIFKLIYRKLHVFLVDSHQFKLDLFNYSVGLHYIYRFITDYNFRLGEMIFDQKRLKAFYSGTFDPFSLGQKAAAVDASDMGFDVYIGISEFQWQRRTQPSMMRKKIVDMSISDQMNIFAFPQHLPINLTNGDDYAKLKALFDQDEIYLIVGEEAVIHDKKYEMPSHPIYQMPHIIYKRQSIRHSEEDLRILKTRLAYMQSDVIMRQLETKYEMIDVDQIRRNIDNNWDAYDVIDDLATHYIKHHKLYKNEPQFKTVVQLSDVELKVVKLMDYHSLPELLEKFDSSYELVEYDKMPERQILLVAEISTGDILAYAIYTRAMPEQLFNEVRSLDVLKDISEKGCQKIVLVDELGMKPYEKVHALDQIILTETLVREIRQGYEYAVVKCQKSSGLSNQIVKVLLRSGFVKYPCTYNRNVLYAVDMREPVIINLDGTTRMKSDYRSNPDIRKTIKEVRNNLQEAVVDLYPGQLVLSFDRSMLYNHLIRLVANVNQVHYEENDERGPYICVPYGDIFKRWLLPNTVTKALHTERYYNEEFSKYDVHAYPGYLSIEEQANVLKAYNHPIILVDDLVDKGNRLLAINKYLKAEEISVARVVVGIMSSRGKNLFEEQGMVMESAYYIPKIKVWFNESDVYPFIGGDSVIRENDEKESFLPSVNLMLPFVYPKYIKDVSKEALYNLSLTCLENAMTILSEVERVYSDINNKILTIEHMKEVMIAPRVPDPGNHVLYDLNFKPTDFIKNELSRLKKMKNAFKDT